MLFDFWDTLIFHERGESQRLKRIRVEGLTEALIKGGFSASPRKVEEVMEEVDMECDRIRVEKGREFDLNTQVHMMMEKLGIPTSNKRLAQNLWDVYAHSVLSVQLRAQEGAESILRFLKEGGYKVGLICNTYHTPSSVIKKILRKFGFLHHFDDVLMFSDEYGLLKPRPEIFLEALLRMGVEPSEALHVGDKPELDILGAKNAGLRAIHLKITDQPYPNNLPKPDATIQALDHIPETLRKL
ncbi:MAG: putative HAD-hydrolase [Candidatus Bathyarchaeota archaeon BA1]|nr:MAG: putative HAD-hydrolase [Candidatus Bathyarchaeota archaeon BA1]